MRSAHTFSSDCMLRLVSVMRMRWRRCSSDSRDFTGFVDAIAMEEYPLYLLVLEGLRALSLQP